MAWAVSEHLAIAGAARTRQAGGLICSSVAQLSSIGAAQWTGVARALVVSCAECAPRLVERLQPTWSVIARAARRCGGRPRVGVDIAIGRHRCRSHRCASGQRTFRGGGNGEPGRGPRHFWRADCNLRTLIVSKLDSTSHAWWKCPYMQYTPNTCIPTVPHVRDHCRRTGRPRRPPSGEPSSLCTQHGVCVPRAAHGCAAASAW